MDIVMNPGPVAETLAHRIRMHGGIVDIRRENPHAAGNAIRIAATAYDRELRFVCDGVRTTADVDGVDPQLIYPSVAELSGACRIEIWHGHRRSRRPLRYSRARDAARCLALAGAMPGSRVSMRVRFSDPESAFAYSDHLLEALRGAFIASAPNVIPFPGRHPVRIMNSTA